MRQFKRFLAAAALTLGFVLVPALSVAAATDPFSAACGLSGVGTSTACDNTGRGGQNPLLGPNGTLTKATKLISYIAGIASIIIIIVAGLMYVNSGGDPSKISSAKDAVIYALVGLIIVIIAQSIVFFVLNKIG